MHCAWEIIDNAVDEALGGFCSRIEVTLHPDGSAEVLDDGRGIPVDKSSPSTGLSGVEVVFTKLHAGGKFGGGSYTASGGLHGVGCLGGQRAVGTGWTSRSTGARQDLRRCRFRRGEPGVFADTGEPAPQAPFTAGPEASPSCGSRRRCGARAPAAPGCATGPTRRSSLPSAPDSATRSWPPGLGRPPSWCPAWSNGDSRQAGAARRRPPRTDPPRSRSRHDGGIAEFCRLPGQPTRRSPTCWRLQGSRPASPRRCRSWTTHGPPEPPGRWSATCAVDIALRWGTGYETARSGPSSTSSPPPRAALIWPDSSSRVDSRSFNAVSWRSTRDRLQGAASDKVDKDDLLAGLTAVVTVRLAEPQFEGQTKEVLGTRGGAPDRAPPWSSSELTAFLADRHQAARGQGTGQTMLLEKVVAADARTRISARLHKETQRRKNALESSSLPAKLADCRSDRHRTAASCSSWRATARSGTAKLARSSDYQALLPIRGKILNVQKASVSDMLQERRVRRDHPGRSVRRIRSLVRRGSGTALRQGSSS